MSEDDQKRWLEFREAFRRPEREEQPDPPEKQSLLKRVREILDPDSAFMEMFLGCLVALLLYSPFGLALAVLAAHVVSGS